MHFNDILLVSLLQNVEVVGNILEQRIGFSHVDVGKVEIHFFLALQVQDLWLASDSLAIFISNR